MLHPITKRQFILKDLIIYSGNHAKFISTQDLIYIRCNGNNCELHFANGEVLSSGLNFNNFAHLENDSNFFRVHKTFILNIKSITQLNMEEHLVFTLVNGERVPLSNRRRHEFFSKYEKL